MTFKAYLKTSGLKIEDKINCSHIVDALLNHAIYTDAQTKKSSQTNELKYGTIIKWIPGKTSSRN